MVGLGRMGANMTRRLLRAGHDCAVYDPRPEASVELAADGALAASSLASLADSLPAPRVVWIMVPAGAVESVLRELAPLLSPGDIVLDGGNSRYVDSVRRAHLLAADGIEFVDVGTSGGIWGLEQGFCLMIGGKPQTVRFLDPIFRALAPGPDAATPTSASTAGSTIDEGYLHCGPSGAGHYVKMVHNGIEYGLMAAYAEGMNLLHHARGPSQGLVDSEIGEIAEVWRRGSVVRSWLLDLAARALQSDPSLAGFDGRVADSGEGRWTIHAGVEAGVPLPVLSAALFARFSSRGESAFADKLLSALRSEFGGHVEPPEKPS
jgi:6-phosphogluconate dehydrogenase